MQIKTFEDILSWQKAKQLSLTIYQEFRDCKDYSFRDQIQRASVSVMNNIAEGYERNGNKEFRNFLFIAKGSCAEVRSMLSLAFELNYIKQESYNSLTSLSTDISKLLSGFIKTLGDSKR
jgi:four helix bundle protein